MLHQFGAMRLTACSLPLLSMAASLLVNVDQRSWRALSISDLSSLAPDAMLYSAGAILILAPLAGVLAATSQSAARGRRGNTLATVRLVLVAVLLFTAVSAVLIRIALGSGSLSFIASSHATMAAVAAALAAFGAFCGARFSDPLDAAACSLALVLLAAVGLLVAGAWVALAPGWIVRAGLFASPLVAIASAAGIDLVRMDTLYRISPLAHLHIEYPTWYAACAWHLLLTFVSFLALRWKGAPAVRSPLTHEDFA